MELYPSWLRKLWKEWDLRLMVLFSLTFQILLNFLGNRRKYSNKLWITIVLWFAYNTADSIATFALGILSSNLIELYDKDHDVAGSSSSLDANTQLSAFWAPFLVLHLGGPDTITAFVLEDNELWSRHLIGLVVQTGMALSVFLMSWTASSLSILSLVMFFVGFIKYAERTWVLRSACIQQRRKSTRSPLSCFEESSPMCIRSEEDRLRLAKDMLYISTRAFVDETMEECVRNSSYIEFSKPLAPKYAFKVIEIELGLIYDMLYTKAPLLYTCGGIVLRLITFSLTCLVMVLYPVLVDKHKYSKVDLWITYLLIIVAVIHDIYAALLMVLSDKFAVWLIKYQKDSIFKAWLIKRLPSTRWSNSMSQYSLLQLSFNSSIANPEKSLKLLERKVSEDSIREIIFEYVRNKAWGAKSRCTPFTELPSTVGQNINNINKKIENSIIIWHIATEVWYYLDHKQQFERCPFHFAHCYSSLVLSRYMMYLLVERPSMLSAAKRDYTHFKDTMNEIERRIKSKSSLEKLELAVYDGTCYATEEEMKWIGNAVTLVRKVNDESQPLERKWKRIESTWMDTLGYTARKCNGNEHAQQLRNGGELLTHVWLLLCHFGLTDHYEINQLNRR